MWSLLDYKSGFGGKYGVQNDRVDKCAVGWEHKEELTKHESQKGKFITNQLYYIQINLISHLNAPVLTPFFTIQITRLGLVVNTEFKMIDKINLQSDGIIKKLCKNMNLRKVENIKYTILIK